MWKKVACFAGGMVATGVLKVISQSKTTRELASKGVAKAMVLNDNIQAVTQNIMDDAEDIRAEAARQRRIDEGVAERLAELEGGIRDEVTAQVDGKAE